MPIDANIQLNPDLPRYGLPVDSCVGDDGPAPTEVTTISKSGKDAAQSGKNPPVGYDGP